MNQWFRSGAQAEQPGIPAVSQRRTNHLNSFLFFFSVSWATMRKNVLRIMGSSGYSDGSLTNRLCTYKGLLGMIEFKNIKAPKYFGNSGDESLHMYWVRLFSSVSTPQKELPLDWRTGERQRHCPGHVCGSRGLQCLCSLD